MSEARVAERAVNGGSARARPTGAGDGVVGHYIADLLLEVVTHLAPAQIPDRLLVLLICCMLPHPNKSRNDKIKSRTMQLFSGAAKHGTVDHTVVAKLGVEHAASSRSCFIFTRRSIAQFSTFQTQCVQSRVFQLSRVASFCPVRWPRSGIQAA